MSKRTRTIRYSGILLSISLLLAGVNCYASTVLRIKYTAVQELLLEKVFVQAGRKYVMGDQNSKCKYGYLEYPKVSAANNRLQISAHYSSRQATELLGTCVGPGLSSDVVVSGIPFVKNAAIGIEDIRIDRIGNEDTAKFLKDYIEKNLKKEVSYTREELEKDLKQAMPGSKINPAFQSLSGTVQVKMDELVLSLDTNIDFE